MRRQFASDNYAGICPEVWKALEAANVGHVPAYGDDSYTEQAADMLREFLETDCEVFFTFNGTAANSLALATLCRSYHSILCHELAHIETDECGAPEFFANGTKILLVPGEHAKVDLDAAEHAITRRSDIHYPKPRVLSLTQPTELGTVYTVEELQAARAFAERFGLRVHMDGARFANALATLDASPADLTWNAGVDVLCLGGTKIGLPVGEAVIFFDRDLADEFDYRCKQAGQLAAKMRFLAAPWIGLLQDNAAALMKYARQSNACAAYLEQRLRNVNGVGILHPREANSVFAKLDAEVAAGLQARGWQFYSFIGDGGARFMCSWDTTNDDVDALVADVEELAGIAAK